MSATTSTVPAWLPDLAARVRVVKLPTAQLTDAIRNHGEDPHDEALWQVRLGQRDILLFGCPARELRKEQETPS